VVGLIKFLLILTVFVYLFRFISPFFIKYFINRLTNKIKHFDANEYSPPPKKKIDKAEKEVGEYIDYEEID